MIAASRLRRMWKTFTLSLAFALLLAFAAMPIFLAYLSWTWAWRFAAPGTRAMGARPATAPASPHPAIDPPAPRSAEPLTTLYRKERKAAIYLDDDLARVPELSLEAVPAERLTPARWQERKAAAVAEALRLNGQEEDGFLKALLRSRPDLADLPFLMGDACRTKGERAKVFKAVAEEVHRRGEASRLVAAVERGASDEQRQLYRQAHVAVASQVLPGVRGVRQTRLIGALAGTFHSETTQALARVAIFARDSSARDLAIEALAGRNEADCTDVLVAGLSYPWPAVAENAARAIVRLERKDLIPQLQAVVLDRPDPRAPRSEVIGGRTVTVASELVRINHHHNCLLCHAPAEPGKTPVETLVAEMPLPTQPLFRSGGGYGRPSRDRQPSPGRVSPTPNLLVRIDVTYLRQDFSALLPVKDASAWAGLQRFDFFVRKRELTPEEAADLRQRLAEKESPYRRVASQALQELSGGVEVKAVPGRQRF
jgi:hypothetical protein